jgi:hypothetical protein
MSPPDNDDTEEGSGAERIRRALKARFAHLSPEKQLRLNVELLRFLSQSSIIDRYPLKPEDEEPE